MKGAYIQMADRFYELHVAGVTRKLPILNVNDKLAIAGFVILGDVELVEKAAAALVKRVPPETEIMGIPLVHEMARLMGMPRYAIARKSVKAYMENPIIVEDRSITTKGKQILVLQDEDIALVRGRKVLLVDDVISTGGSIKALEELIEKAGGTVIGRMAILAEGDAMNRKDIVTLENLPLFDAQV